MEVAFYQGTWVFDVLVCNTDRHLTNLGYLYDASTARLLGPAPVFDNGRGLFPNVQDNQLADAAMLAALSRPASGGDSFEQAASRVMGDRQLAVLETMAGFEFDLEKLPSSLHARAHVPSNWRASNLSTAWSLPGRATHGGRTMHERRAKRCGR